MEKNYEQIWAQIPQYLRDEYEEIIQGKRLPSFTSDVAFRKLLDPEVHRDRVEKIFRLVFEVDDIEVISSMKTVHPKPSLLSKGTVQDINVLLSEGGALNLEMQVKAQEFIVNRMNIYASDMNILQYSVSRGQRKGDMDFGDIGHSYLVVFMKESPNIFKASPYFIHKKLEITDTGIELNRITTMVYIELDKCLAYVKEHGLLYGREELCMLLVLMADSNSEETKALARESKEVQDMLIELGTMTQNREELLDMLTNKYADDIKYSEMQSARREGKAEGIINTMRALQATPDQIVEQLVLQMGLSEAEATKLLEER